MALQADLAVRLDASGLQASLMTDLAEVRGALGALPVPLDPAALESAVAVAGRIDLSDLKATAAGVAESLGEVTGRLPRADSVLTEVTGILDLAAELTEGDIEAEIRTLIDRLSSELDEREGGALEAFIRFSEGLKGAPQAALLMNLYGVFVKAGGAPGLGEIRLPDLLPAVAAAIRALGALLALDTLLEETARLSRTISAQVDLEAIAAQEATLVARLEALPASIAATDVTDPAAVEVAARAVAEVKLALAAHVRGVAETMAFGEGMLVYIDFPRLIGEVEELLGELRAEDLSAIERAVAGLAAKIAPLLRFDLSRAPRFALAELLDAAEARAAEIAERIAAADLSVITQPLTAGLSEVTRVPAELAGKLDAVELAAASALEGARSAIAEAPLDRVGDAVGGAARALGEALRELNAVLGAIESTVGAAAAALQGALDDAEAAIGRFAGGIEATFRDAATFVDGLNLDRVAGQVADNVAGFSAVVAKANMAPHFSSATDAINGAARVVEKVPFALLPDAMEQEVVAVARPIKQTDLDALRVEIRSTLQIGEGGTFALRRQLEAAVQEVQARFDALLATLRQHEPAQVAAQLRPALDDLRREVEAVSPGIDLGAIRAALDQAKAAVASLDPATVLAPVDAAFDRALAAVDEFNPADLLDPVEARIAEAREKVIEPVRLREWRSQLDLLETQIKDLLGRLDLSRFDEDIERGLAEARRLIEDSEEIGLLDGIGSFLTAMLAGGGRRMSPASFAAVTDWLGGASARAALEGHAAEASARVEATRQQVVALDPQAMAARWAPGLGAVDVVIRAKADGAGRLRLQAASAVADPAVELARIGANRGRYLATLDGAVGAANRLGDLALGEADTTAGRLRGALSPLSPVTTLLRSVADIVGVSGSLRGGVSGVLLDLLDAAPPERLSAMLNPVYQAVYGRLESLLTTVLDPVRQGIDDLLAAIEAISLDGLRTGIGAIHGAIRAEIEALRPDTLLAEPLAAFAEARSALLAFDPLGAVTEALEAVRSSALRVAAKLDADALLAAPQAIFDAIVGAFERLDIGALLAPLLDQLDGLAAQVDQGLESTVLAFKRLQDALPDKVGSTSLSGSVTVN